jgi:hypothetical protein
MSDEPDPPEQPQSALDLFRTLQHDLNRDLMAVYETLPASLEAIVEGYDGPIDIPPEQGRFVTAPAPRGAWYSVWYLERATPALWRAFGRCPGWESNPHVLADSRV